MDNRLEAYTLALQDIQYIMKQYEQYKPEAWVTVRKIVAGALHPHKIKKGDKQDA